jgi:hypothetical protein
LIGLWGVLRPPDTESHIRHDFARGVKAAASKRAERRSPCLRACRPTTRAADAKL